MNFFPMPSLGHIALVKVAVCLFTEEDVRELESNFCFSSWDPEGKRFNEFLNKMMKKASKLLLPDLVESKLIGCIRPITMRIVSWLSLHGDRCYIIPTLPQEYCWTPFGFIDYQKTAENWVNEKRFDIVSHFRFAITYCLENNIKDIWKQLPKDISPDLKYIGTQEPELLCYWLHILFGKTSKLDTALVRYSKSLDITTFKLTPKCGLKAAVSKGNHAATKYFLSKLTPEEKENIIVNNARHAVKRRLSTDYIRFPKHSYTDIFCLLLSIMNETQQIQTFREETLFVLKCFLDWPWQGFFLELLERTWEFIFPECYYFLLQEISKKTVDGYKDYDYQELFIQVWRKILDANKEYIIDMCVGGSLMLGLFGAKAKECIAVILNGATIDKKEEILFGERGKHICKYLVERNLLDMLEYFVDKCATSKDMMTKFKLEFKNHIVSVYSTKKIRKGAWRECFYLLDKCIRKWNKRAIIDGDDVPVKKLCSGEVE